MDVMEQFRLNGTKKIYSLEIELTSGLTIDVLLIERETRKMFELNLNLGDKTEQEIYSTLSRYVSKLIEK